MVCVAELGEHWHSHGGKEKGQSKDVNTSTAAISSRIYLQWDWKKG